MQANYSDFAGRLTSFLDDCLEENLTLVINEAEHSDRELTMYICEKTEFRCLVHLEIGLTAYDDRSRCTQLSRELAIQQALAAHYYRQKIFLV